LLGIQWDSLIGRACSANYDYSQTETTSSVSMQPLNSEVEWCRGSTETAVSTRRFTTVLRGRSPSNWGAIALSSRIPI